MIGDLLSIPLVERRLSARTMENFGLTAYTGGGWLNIAKFPEVFRSKVRPGHPGYNPIIMGLSPGRAARL